MTMQGDIRLRQYLLGSLSESEREDLDLRVIEDESITEEVALAEHEILEDFLEGDLSAEEERLFNANFLISPERRSMLRRIALLKEFAKKKTAAEAEPAATELRPGFFTFYFRPLLAGAALTATALLTGVVWFAFVRDARSPLELRYAEMNRQDLSEPSRLSEYSQINLGPVGFRDAAEAPRESADRLTETVALRLALPANTADGSLYSVIVRRPGAPDFSIDGVKAYRNPAGYELRVLVPEASLAKDQHQIIVNPQAGGQTVSTYTFILE
jgi:hypothetical protein